VLKRYITRVGVSLAIVSSLVVAMASPAAAASGGYDVQYTHSGGATLISEVTGTVNWLNRSVSISGNQSFIRGGYCYMVTMSAYAGSTHITADDWTAVSSGGGVQCSPGGWTNFADHTFDGSNIVGGLTKVQIEILVYNSSTGTYEPARDFNLYR
jgi:hypothetical protein